MVGRESQQHRDVMEAPADVLIRVESWPVYLRFTRRRKDGKEYRCWSIVESKRCAGGWVVQRPVLYLGEINDSHDS